MNIAPSPDPSPATSLVRDFTGTASSANDFNGISFDNFLGAPSENAPDGKQERGIAQDSPREEPAKKTDPALAALLPFLLPQAAPAPLPPPATAGDKIEIGDVNSACSAPFDSDASTPREVEAMRNTSNAIVVPFEISKGNAVADRSPMQTPDGKMIPETSEAHAVVQIAGQKIPFTEQVCAMNAGESLNPETAVAPASAGSATAMQLAQPALSGTNAPAEFSDAALQVTSSAAGPQTGAVPENAIAQMPPHRNAGVISAPQGDGTTVAMQRRAMPEQILDHQLKSKANVAVVSSAHGESRAAVLPELRDHPAAAPAALATADLRSESAANNGHGTAAPIHTPDGSDTPASADFTAAVRITKQTIDLAEHIRAMGRDHVEVQMRLRDGQEVTVSLRLEQGEWKPVFKTDTEALCRALEQNWHSAAAQPSAQAVKFGTPVFESQRAQTDLGHNPQQQPDGRGRAFDRREQEPAFANPSPPARKKPVAANPARPAANTAVQLYA